MANISKFKKGDRLFVLSGREKGKIGELLKVLPEKKRVLIKGLNIVIRNTKANAQTNEPGGQIKKESPLSLSNVALVCPKCTDPTRVGHRFLAAEEGHAPRKVRFCKRCNADIDE